MPGRRVGFNHETVWFLATTVDLEFGSGWIPPGGWCVRRRPMNRLRTAGILWVVSALVAAGISLVFRVDPAQVVVTIAASAVAAVLGLWMIARPATTAVPLSYVVGLAWLALYAALTFQQSAELVAWTTDVFLALIGVGAALAAYRGTREAVSRRS